MKVRSAAARQISRLQSENRWRSAGEIVTE